MTEDDMIHDVLQLLSRDFIHANTNTEVATSSLESCRVLWSNVEETILTGIVTDVFHSRHSLKPTDIEKEAAKEHMLPLAGIVWNKISHKYNVARKRFMAETSSTLPSRSMTALQKRWKYLGKQERKRLLDHVAKHNNDDAYVSGTKQRYLDWETKYNVHKLLTCSEEGYNKFVMNQQDLLVCGMMDEVTESFN